jgi:hypothetical protein
MAPSVIRKVIGILGLVAWLPFMLALYPMPHQAVAEIEREMRQTEKELGPLAKRVSPKPLEERIDDIQMERWLLWALHASLLLLGIVASGISLKGVGVWKGLMLTLSALFLALYVLDFSAGPSASVGEVFGWKLQMVENFRDQGRVGAFVFFGLKEFVLPVVHLAILGLLLYYSLKVKSEQAVSG